MAEAVSWQIRISLEKDYCDYLNCDATKKRHYYLLSAICHNFADSFDMELLSHCRVCP